MANRRIYWLHTLSPTHVGTGRGIGYIDLPIHREKVTNWPAIPGSAFKGVWRDWAQEAKIDATLMDLAFGRASDTNTNDANSGSLIPTDARIVCLPIRSFKGTFAWCTSPLALQMLHRDLVLCGQQGLPASPTKTETDDTIHRPRETILDEKGKIYLEDLDFPGKECSTAYAWADWIGKRVFEGQWQKAFISRFAVLPNDVFDFLTTTGTQVDARVCIEDELKTVKEGALWNEESLPAETILAGLVSCDRVYQRKANGNAVDERTLLETFAKETLTLQIGGKATIGRGRVRCIFTQISEGAA